MGSSVNNLESNTATTGHCTTPAAIGRAYRSARAWVLFLAVALGGLAADLGSKYWSFATVAGKPVDLSRAGDAGEPLSQTIPPHAGVHLLPFDLLDLRLVVNHGAVFGLGANRRFFFVAFTIGALLVAIVCFCRLLRQHKLGIAALGLIVAGGVGNLYDRMVYGVVRDFLQLMPGYELPFDWSWPGGSPELFPWVFNLADTMLLSGMVMLMLHLNRAEKRRTAGVGVRGTATTS